ncbi:hypothetical protein SAMN02745163_00154 [Clostridium cavendishii DSM 21758]|uniref:Uncharacterized protein n=1 Tax=Clostridium cavendishii DSM 21758 TaxID=1121302 RepID=A0A1M6AR80_9CLOT|nr:hypothetical protein [Clostridium cavendishii]SHI38907.1 hypothetical protein SAMN02745163_00154 [Clostridium cavendishii DSM 21758]
MEKLKRSKTINIAIAIFILESIFLISSFFIKKFIILNEFSIIRTETQGILLTVLGIIYLIMVIGILFWREWAMYGVLSVRISITVLFLIGTSLDIFIIIIQIALLLLTIVTIFKLLDTKFKSIEY